MVKIGMTVSIPKINPEKVREKRRSAGYKRIYDVVKRKGLDHRVLTGYEDPDRGLVNPTLRGLWQLAAAYRCTITDFFDEDILSIPPELEDKPYTPPKRYDPKALAEAASEQLAVGQY
jgi:transcriptional regulator with XRE-family HTH domain